MNVNVNLVRPDHVASFQLEVICKFVCYLHDSMMYIILLPNLPWVPEPQNLNERKLVRGKERRKKGKLSFLPYFSFYYFLALVPRVCPIMHFLRNLEGILSFRQ